MKNLFDDKTPNIFVLEHLVVVKLDDVDLPSLFEHHQNILNENSKHRPHLYLLLKDFSKYHPQNFDEVIVSGVGVYAAGSANTESLSKVGFTHFKDELYFRSFSEENKLIAEQNTKESTQESSIDHQDATINTAIDSAISIIGGGSRLLQSARSRFYFEFSFDKQNSVPLALKQENRFYLNENANIAKEREAEYKALVKIAGSQFDEAKHAPKDDLQTHTIEELRNKHIKAKADAQKKLDELSFGGQIYRYYSSRFKHTYFSYKNPGESIRHALENSVVKRNWFSQFRLPFYKKGHACPQIKVSFGYSQNHKDEIIADVVDLNLTVMDSDEPKSKETVEQLPVSKQACFLLGFECQPTSAQVTLDMSNWRCLLHAFSDDPLSARAYIWHHQTWVWLKFNSLVRLIKPTFLEQIDEDKIGTISLKTSGALKGVDVHELNTGVSCVGDIAKSRPATPADYFDTPDNAVIARLAKQFFTQPDDFQQNFNSFVPLDSRMFTVSHIAFPGDTPVLKAVKEHNRKIFNHFKYADTYDGFDYDPDFVRELSSKQDYRRWDNTTSYTSFNEFAATTMGFNWFAQNIQPNHWMRQYNYFIEYGLISRYFLHELGERIQRNTALILCNNYEKRSLEEDDTSQEQFRDLRRDFITYMNSYWFNDVTREQQGIEIFDKAKVAMGLDVEFKRVQDKIAWADEFIESRRQVTIARKANTIAKVALFFAIFSVIASSDIDFCALVTDISGEEKTAASHIWNGTDSFCPFSSLVKAVLGVCLFIIRRDIYKLATKLFSPVSKFFK